MRVLVVGCGSIGQRHVSNIRTIIPGVTIGIYDPKLSGAPYLSSWESALKQPWNAALVCSPPAYHLEQFRELTSKSIPTFVEKPFCLPEQLDDGGGVDGVGGGGGVDGVKKEWKRLSRTLPIMVGHNLFWHPYVKLLRQFAVDNRIMMYVGRFGHYLPYMRPPGQGEYSLSKAAGGGVVLDCLQDIGLACHLVGDVKVTHMSKTFWPLNSNNDAESAGIMQFTSPLTEGVITMDYLRRIKLRSIEMSGPDGTICWENEVDRLSGRGQDKLWTKGSDDWKYCPITITTAEAGNVFVNLTYRDEMDAFLKWVRDGVRPEIEPDPFTALEVLQRATALTYIGSK